MGVSVSKNGVECRRTLLPRRLLAFTEATAALDVMVVFTRGATPGINTQTLQNYPGITGVEAVEVSNSVALSPDFVPDNSKKPRGVNPSASDDDGGSSSNVGLIAGICGGVGGLLLIVVGAVLYSKSKKEEHMPMIQAINTQDLKAQLVEEL
eukprot:1969128-Rhodomonas_salina.2